MRWLQSPGQFLFLPRKQNEKYKPKNQPSPQKKHNLPKNQAKEGLRCLMVVSYVAGKSGFGVAAT